MRWESPLTLTLSPSAGARELPASPSEISRGLSAVLSPRFPLSLRTILPLPFGRGEGRGEGIFSTAHFQ